VITSNKELKIQLILLCFHGERMIIDTGFLTNFFYRISMQKKLLSLLIAASCSMVYADEFSTSEKIEQVRRELAWLQQQQKNEHIAQYARERKAAFEAALVMELSGTADALKKEYDKDKKASEDEEAQEKLKVYDGGWTGGPTVASVTGRAYEELSTTKKHKDKINADYHKLVNDNKNRVISGIKNELEHKYYVTMSVYLRGLQECSGDVNCLRRKGISWEDVKKDGFFDDFRAEVYGNAVAAAKKEGIDLSPDKMIEVTHANQSTLELEKKLDSSIAQVKEEVNRILNPQPISTSRIDLTGDDKNKSKIFDTDLKDDQNDQGTLSQ